MISRSPGAVDAVVRDCDRDVVDVVIAGVLLVLEVRRVLEREHAGRRADLKEAPVVGALHRPRQRVG